MSYSLDLRERVIRFVGRGGRKALAARLYGVTRFTVYYWLKKKANTGSLVDIKAKRRWKKLDPESLVAYVNANPDFTLKEYAKQYGVSAKSVCLALKRLKITRKKRVIFTKKGMKKSV